MEDLAQCPKQEEGIWGLMKERNWCGLNQIHSCQSCVIVIRMKSYFCIWKQLIFAEIKNFFLKVLQIKLKGS